jgi:hypothetical protein
MSGFIHIDRIKTRAYSLLPPQVQEAIIHVKNTLKTDPAGAAALTPWGNSFGGPADGPPLPKVSVGCRYYEEDVGAAHPNDPLGGRGRRRLVFEIDPVSKIKETYYTEQHYAKGSFVRIV